MCLSDTSSLSGTALAILLGGTLFFKWSNVTFRTEGTDGLEDLETEKWPVANSKVVAWTTNNLRYDKLVHTYVCMKIDTPHHACTLHHTTPHHTTPHHTAPHHTTPHYTTHTQLHQPDIVKTWKLSQFALVPIHGVKSLHTAKEESMKLLLQIHQNPQRTIAEQGHPHLAAPPTPPQGWRRRTTKMLDGCIEGCSKRKWPKTICNFQWHNLRMSVIQIRIYVHKWQLELKLSSSRRRPVHLTKTLANC